MITSLEICKAREALMLEDIKKIKKTDISKVQLPEKKKAKPKSK